MLSRELRKLIPEFVEWIESNRITSFYPRDVAQKFNLNEESAKQLVKLAENEVTEFELMKPRLDGKRVIKI